MSDNKERTLGLGLKLVQYDTRLTAEHNVLILTLRNANDQVERHLNINHPDVSRLMRAAAEKEKALADRFRKERDWLMLVVPFAIVAGFLLAWFVMGAARV